ncbi:Protein phosphatase 2C [Diplonema papillatum]|nr:Protein phosphatase 2C [Diplonema papillatum]
MGNSLTAPVTTKLLERHNYRETESRPGLQIGVSSMNGWRQCMEDAHLVSVKPDVALFGVFDGHGGSACSHFLSSRLAKEINNGAIDDDEVQNLALRLDSEYLQTSETGETAGSTGTFVLASALGINKATGKKQYKLQVANVGDSRVVLSHVNGGSLEDTVLLTIDHKPTDEGEFQRIVAANGHVSNNRVNGDLALSRAFGDGRFKRGGSDSRTHQVTALPDVTHAVCHEGDIVVACCDGVFESGCFTDHTIMEFVHERLTARCDLALVAAAVCDEAVARGSRDNITCIVMVVGAAASQEVPDDSVAKWIHPGPVSCPKSSRFMNAYSDAARAGQLTLAECVDLRYGLVQAWVAEKDRDDEEMEIRALRREKSAGRGVKDDGALRGRLILDAATRQARNVGSLIAAELDDLCLETDADEKPSSYGTPFLQADAACLTPGRSFLCTTSPALPPSNTPLSFDLSHSHKPPPHSLFASSKSPDAKPSIPLATASVLELRRELSCIPLPAALKALPSGTPARVQWFEEFLRRAEAEMGDDDGSDSGSEAPLLSRSTKPGNSFGAGCVVEGIVGTEDEGQAWLEVLMAVEDEVQDDDSDGPRPVERKQSASATSGFSVTKPSASFVPTESDDSQYLPTAAHSHANSHPASSLNPSPCAHPLHSAYGSPAPSYQTTHHYPHSASHSTTGENCPFDCTSDQEDLLNCGLMLRKHKKAAFASREAAVGKEPVEYCFEEACGSETDDDEEDLLNRCVIGSSPQAKSGTVPHLVSTVPISHRPLPEAPAAAAVEEVYPFDYPSSDDDDHDVLNLCVTQR